MISQTKQNRHKKMTEIFSSAIKLPPEKQADFLRSMCGDDEELRVEIAILLEAREEARAFLEGPSAVSVIEDAISHNNKLEGKLIDKYCIIREIGRGGMGMVFLAERKDFHQQVALKLIKRGMDSDAILERFKREREILANLNHPFIARLLDGGTTEEGTPFFAMEYVEGTAVNEYCQLENLSTDEHLSLFRKICEAVSFAHQKLVVHRDLKPSNILVTKDGTPKLLDFGIAKLLNSDNANDTQTNQRALTPAYASPEQIRGEQVDTTSDVYSLGKILSEILQLPVGETSREKTKTTNQTGNSDLRAILQTSMREERTRRYNSVEKLSDDIRRYLAGLPVTARRDTLAYRTSKFLQRNRLAVSAAAIILLTLVGGIVATTWEAYVARAERAKAERRFNEVRKLAHTFMFDYHDELPFVAGTTGLRQRMVKDALEYLDGLSSEGGDPTLQKEIAEAYIKIGDVQGRSAAPNLGDTKGAFDEYRKSAAILEEMTAHDPQNTPERFDLAASYERLGEMNSTSGKPTEAVQYFRQSLNIIEELRAAAPNEPALQSSAAFTHRMLGQVLGVPSASNIGDEAGALEQLQQAASIYEAIPIEKLTPDSSHPFLGYLDKKHDLSSAYGDITEVMTALGRQTEATEYERKAIALLEKELSEEPDNVAVRRNLAVNYGNLGTYLLNAGDTTGALQLYHQSLTIAEALAAADENNTDAKKNLATSYRNLGKAFTATKDKKMAAESYQKAISIFENLVAKDQSNAFLRRNLAFTYLKMSQLLSGTDDINGAINYAQKSVSIGEELVAADSKNVTAKNTLAQTDSQLGECHTLLAAKTTTPHPQQLAQWKEAEDWYQKSLNLWQEMKAQGNLNAADSGKIDEVDGKILKCETMLHR